MPNECSVRPFLTFIPVPVPLSTFGAISWHRAFFSINPIYPLVTAMNKLAFEDFYYSTGII